MAREEEQDIPVCASDAGQEVVVWLEDEWDLDDFGLGG